MTTITVERPAEAHVEPGEREEFYLYGFTHGDGFAASERPTDRDTAATKLTVLACLFGHMVQRAEGMQAYHGDLFHDAQWLDKHIDGPCTFWWMVRDFGTYIGVPGDDLFNAVRTNNRSVPWYEVELLHRKGGWYVAFTLHTPIGA